MSDRDLREQQTAVQSRDARILKLESLLRQSAQTLTEPDEELTYLHEREVCTVLLA